MMNSTMDNSSYIGALVLASTGKKLIFFPIQIIPIDKAMLSMSVIMADRFGNVPLHLSLGYEEVEIYASISVVNNYLIYCFVYIFSVFELFLSLCVRNGKFKASVTGFHYE